MSNSKSTSAGLLVVLAALFFGMFIPASLVEGAAAAKAAAKPEFPSLAEVTKDYQKVVSTADGARSLYTIWTRLKDGQMLAALPAGYESKKFFVAVTVASGEDYAGLQAGDMYVYWKL